MPTFAEFFNELLFGSGAWLGFLLIITIVLLLSLKVKYSSIILIPTTIMIGILYLENVAVNSNFMWATIIMFLLTPFMLLIESQRKS